MTALAWERGRDPVSLLEREWLVTNGRGGYASGSLAGATTRKYHGLFVPNLASPRGRHVLVPRCDEAVLVNGRLFQLSNVESADGRLSGEAHQWLRELRLDRGIVHWCFELGDTVIERSILMVHLHDTVCIRYRLLHGSAAQLYIRPFVSFRRHDQVLAADADRSFFVQMEEGYPGVHVAGLPVTLRMTVQPEPATFTSDPQDHNEWVYRIDRNRGEPALERVFSPGWFGASLSHGRPACFVASTDARGVLDGDALAAFAAEQRRLDELVTRSTVDAADQTVRQLVMASDQFIVVPGSRPEESVVAQAQGARVCSVYAGYHWFGDWGRDTMISLEGLTLCTKRYREAGAILETFASYVRDGLLPNLFPEGERQALYHTVDATLWYFHAVDRYLQATSDRALLERLFPVLESIVGHHVAGTRFGIHMDRGDGLISAAADGYQLTWMDAKVNDWVVTPRRGKPVEIQALWYNALALMTRWAAALERTVQIDYAGLASQVRASFNQRFWNDGALFDVIDGPAGDDPSFRPNQILAISLPNPVLESSRWQAVVDAVRERLLTPFGLRTLDPAHPDYKARYRGDLLARDAAYHQGTVWPWLIGPFIDAWLKVYPDPARAREWLQAFPAHLTEAGIGSISEIFDAEHPHVPGGCMAQAWSVAEVLRAWIKTGTPVGTR